MARNLGKSKVSHGKVVKSSKAGLIEHIDEYEQYFGKEATMARRASKSLKNIALNEDASLGEQLSFMDRAKRGFMTHAGRGHGRQTPHGRGKRIKAVPFRNKKDSIHFLEACVTDYRMYPRTNKVFENFSSTWKLASTTEWANLLSRQTQYFDCDIIWEYVSENYKNMYPDNDVPPSPDCVLPAEHVALYLSEFSMQMLNYNDPIEALFLCIPQNENLDSKDPYYRRNYHVFLISAGEATVDLGQFTMPLPIGNIVVADTETGPDHMFEHLLMHEIEKYGFVKEEAKEMLRIVAALLQTINQPRYVRRAQRDVSQIKRQRIKNSLGRYIPDAWNMISWNVDEPVMAKNSEEGTGSRQGLHYRRGHWRKAESHWAGARWSETRLRWETFIHGYEAGHPKYGVLKSYHVPRKDKK